MAQPSQEIYDSLSQERTHFAAESAMLDIGVNVAGRAMDALSRSDPNRERLRARWCNSYQRLCMLEDWLTQCSRASVLRPWLN